MKKTLLILLVLGSNILQTSAANEKTYQPNSTLTHANNTDISQSYGTKRSIYSTDDGAYVSSNEEINQAIDELSVHGKQKEYQLASLSEKVETESFDEIKRRAELGSPKYQSKLARLYEDGDGVQQDHRKAVEWYRKSANQGYALSEALLGFKYYTGEGVRHDYKKALELLLKAVNHKDEPQAETEGVIGEMYELGQGVRRNKIIAKDWYGKSCDNGYQEGCNQYRRLNLE